MWRGENPVQDFDRFMSVVLSDLLNQEVDRILADMKASRIAAAIRLFAMKEKANRSGMLAPETGQLITGTESIPLVPS